MADLVFAFDPAIDRPLAVPPRAHPAVAEIVGRAAATAFAEAVAVAHRGQASILVVCGRWLDPHRGSPAQAAAVRTAVLELAAAGCRTVYLAPDADTCRDVSRMLGEPQGLCFVTPEAALDLDVHGITVELVAAGPLASLPAPLAADDSARPRRRIVIGHDTTTVFSATDDAWHSERDAAADFVAAAAGSPAWTQPGSFWIWASRRPAALPPGIHHLPPLQPRSAAERGYGSCCTLTLIDRGQLPEETTWHPDWRSSWRDIPTQQVGWRTVRIESPPGAAEELATALWTAIEQVAPGEQAPLELVHCIVECGTSVSRRVEIGELADDVLARLRNLFDPKSFRAWCTELVADPHESLAPLGHARSGGRPGATTSFTSALADIVQVIEQTPASPLSPAAARAAGWVALELIESA
ncbi:MAG: hypothetical protein RLZZ440_2306 [Planctomycetota bacterium]